MFRPSRNERFRRAHKKASSSSSSSSPSSPSSPFERKRWPRPLGDPYRVEIPKYESHDRIPEGDEYHSRSPTWISRAPKWTRQPTEDIFEYPRGRFQIRNHVPLEERHGRFRVSEHHDSPDSPSPMVLPPLRAPLSSHYGSLFSKSPKRSARKSPKASRKSPKASRKSPRSARKSPKASRKSPKTTKSETSPVLTPTRIDRYIKELDALLAEYEREKRALDAKFLRSQPRKKN